LRFKNDGYRVAQRDSADGPAKDYKEKAKTYMDKAKAAGYDNDKLNGAARYLRSMALAYAKTAADFYF